jgi:sorting nexin-29
MDVRTFRGANIDSDHYLLISKIRSCISNARKTYGSYARKFNSEKLKSPETSSAYRDKLNEYLARHVDNNDDIKETWTLLKNAITQTAGAILNRIETVTHTDWFDTECEQATINKNKAYKRMQQRNHTWKAVEEYRTARSEEKRVQKQKKKIFIERGLKELECLRGKNEGKSFYRKLNRSRKDFQPRTILCQDKEGMLLSEEDDILRRWAEHFDEQLNIEFSNQNITSKEIYQSYLDTDEPTPTLDEVDNTTQKLKDNKAPGMDLIQAELVKKASPNFVECMYQLITKIWITKTITEAWNWYIICPIHKKGNVTICLNYRGIRLLCVACKIFSNILFNRLMLYVEATTGDYQCGYRGERSTVDQIFTIRLILEKCSEHGKDTHNLFIDFKAAYDSIDTHSLYAAMEKLNIPQKLIALIKAAMNNTQCRVKIQNKLSQPINVTNGVRQEDALACLLFNTALEKVIRDTAVNTRGTIFYKSVQILAYADDIDIIGRTQLAMIEAFTTLEKAAKDMNLFINQEKTKYMPATKKSHASYPHYLEVGPNFR